MRLLTALVLLLPALAAAQTPDLVATLTTPILAWSNRASLGLQQEPQVSYEVIARSEAFTSNLMLAGLGKLSDAVGLGSLLSADQLKAQQHSTVVVFIGSQLTSATLRRGGASAAQLNALLGAATSSVVLPYTHAEGETVLAALIRTAKDAGLQLKSVGCGPDAIDTTAAVTSSLADSTDLLQVLLVCAQVPAEQDRTPEGMAAELAQLLATQQAVAASGLTHLFVYTSETIPTAMLKPAVRTAGRSLLQDQPTGEDTSSTFVGFGNYTACGALCQTQVRWLEGMLAVLFMALAACSGLLCLYMLDTPTRFETPKDAGAAQ